MQSACKASKGQHCAECPGISNRTKVRPLLLLTDIQQVFTAFDYALLPCSPTSPQPQGWSQSLSGPTPASAPNLPSPLPSSNNVELPRFPFWKPGSPQPQRPPSLNAPITNKITSLSPATCFSPRLGHDDVDAATLPPTTRCHNVRTSLPKVLTTCLFCYIGGYYLQDSQLWDHHIWGNYIQNNHIWDNHIWDKSLPC